MPQGGPRRDRARRGVRDGDGLARARGGDGARRQPAGSGVGGGRGVARADQHGGRRPKVEPGAGVGQARVRRGADRVRGPGGAVRGRLAARRRAQRRPRPRCARPRARYRALGGSGAGGGAERGGGIDYGRSGADGEGGKAHRRPPRPRRQHGTARGGHRRAYRPHDGGGEPVPDGRQWPGREPSPAGMRGVRRVVGGPGDRRPRRHRSALRAAGGRALSRPARDGDG